MAEFRPRILVDCGCGHGGISQAFLTHGCEEAYLFDGSRHAVDIARSKGLRHVAQIDFTTADRIPAQGDLAICLEVAEHLPKAFAANLCRIVSGAAPTVIFTAAPPGRGGHLHVNTQPQTYWIDLFSRYGHEFDAESVQRIRTSFAGRMLEDYDAHLMVFRRRPNSH